MHSWWWPIWPTCDTVKLFVLNRTQFILRKWPTIHNHHNLSAWIVTCPRSRAIRQEWYLKRLLPYGTEYEASLIAFPFISFCYRGSYFKSKGWAIAVLVLGICSWCLIADVAGIGWELVSGVGCWWQCWIADVGGRCCRGCRPGCCAVCGWEVLRPHGVARMVGRCCMVLISLLERRRASGICVNT